ncbi:MAG: OmpA family protein [Chthoniobacteraceae bacterium]
MNATQYPEAPQSDTALFRRWLLGALVFSLLLHLALGLSFYFVPLDHFDAPVQRLVPPTFKVNRVVIDASKLNSSDEEPAKPAHKAATAKPLVDLPSDNESFDKLLSEVHAVPSAPDPIKPMMTEKPHVEATNLQSLAIQQKAAAEQADKELAVASQQLLQDSTKRPLQPSLSLDQLAKAAESSSHRGEALPGSEGTQGYSDLDNLLGQGQLKGKVAPLKVPGGALFEFDKYDLRSDAILTMQKLGRLIQKNPGATFTVEGYTDSIGDAPHNQDLSQRRAEAIKLWLVSNMGIDPAKVEAIGYGSTKFKVQPTTTDANGNPLSLQQQIDLQAPNRRVEIVIKTPE